MVVFAPVEVVILTSFSGLRLISVKRTPLPTILECHSNVTMATFTNTVRFG